MLVTVSFYERLNEVLVAPLHSNLHWYVNVLTDGMDINEVQVSVCVSSTITIVMVTISHRASVELLLDMVARRH